MGYSLQHFHDGPLALVGGFIYMIHTQQPVVWWLGDTVASISIEYTVHNNAE
jgi:hypothetical protein